MSVIKIRSLFSNRQPSVFAKWQRGFLKAAFLCVVAGFFLSNLPEISQGQTGTVMTWNDCVSAVRLHNPDLAAAVAFMKSAEALYGGSASGFYPQLSASVGYTDSSVAGSVPTAGALTQVVTVQNQYTESLSVNQNIFNGFSDVGRIRQGRANYLAAKAQLELEKVTLASALKTAFAQLLYQQASVDLSASILKRQIANLRMIDLRFRGGNENKGSLLFQQATVAQAQYQFDHSKRQLRNAMKQLGALWGEPNIRSLQISGELTSHLPAQPPNFEEIAAAHPNHVNFVEQEKSAVAALDIANGNWYPNVGLVGSAGRVGSDWPPDNTRWSVGVSVTFPFFPGTSTYYNAESARALKNQAEYNSRSTDFKLIAALENAYESFLDAVSQVDVAQQFSRAAEARSKIANGRYNTGLMTFEDWTVIDQDLVAREQTLLQSQLNAMQAEASWENAAGIENL